MEREVEPRPGPSGLRSETDSSVELFRRGAAYCLLKTGGSLSAYRRRQLSCRGTVDTRDGFRSSAIALSPSSVVVRLRLQSLPLYLGVALSSASCVVPPTSLVRDDAPVWATDILITRSKGGRSGGVSIDESPWLFCAARLWTEPAPELRRRGQ